MTARTFGADDGMDFAARLLAWYDAHARVLPWRVPPGSDIVPDPYRVWLAEVMLQQTTVAAVGRYFAEFTARWPTVADLAAADDAAVMAAWAGLGYYARARNLLACARAVVADHGGRFPASEAALRTLPGIGAYTAAAVAAIAFDQRAVVIDANIERVIARHGAIDQPLPAAKRAIAAYLDPLVPMRRAGDFAQGLMDLGAGPCAPRAPDCARCPLAEDCAGRRAGVAATLPVKAAKRAKPQRHGSIWWIEQDGQLWLVRRPPRGLLGGMRALPGSDWHDGPPAPGDRVMVRHSFTHFDLSLTIEPRDARQDLPPGEWWPIETIEQAGLPTLYRKAAALMREDRE